MATSGRMGRPRRGEEKPVSLPASLRRGLEDLGLSPYEARVLLALFKLGSANSTQLAKESTVPRTAVYPVLESLGTKRLAERLGGEGPAVWATPGREEVFARLQAALAAEQDERMRQHAERAGEIQKQLATALPEAPQAALPYVHILRGASHVKATYDALLARARFEQLMFTRPPYAYTVGKPNQAVLDMLARGVRSRVLYQAEQWHEPAAESFRAEMDVYHRAGVEARLADEVPTKLVVVDRAEVLLGMAHPTLEDKGYPTFVHLEHPGAAAVLADSFEQRWATATPLVVQKDEGGSAEAKVVAMRERRPGR